MPAQRRRQPQVRDEQPLRPDLPEHTTKHLVVRVAQENGNRIVLLIPCLREIVRAESLSNDLLETLRGVRLHDNPKILHGLDSPQSHTTSPREVKVWREGLVKRGGKRAKQRAATGCS